MKILCVLGSLQQRSANRALIELASQRRPAGVDLRPSLSLGDLPHYNADQDANEVPSAVATWRREIEDCDAVFIATPEYGHGMPGTLKNALDWVTRSGQFMDKRVAATCAAQGEGRGLLGLESLSRTLRAISARVVWEEPIIVSRSSIDNAGRIQSDEVEQRLTSLLDRLTE